MRVRPLLGGFSEWKRRGYPLEEIVFEKAQQKTAAD